MTRTSLLKSARSALAIGLGAAIFAFAAPAAAIADPVVDAGRASGLIGEQADGFIGLVPGASVDADLRARVDQINIRRRQVYTQRAAERGVTVNEMAAAVACEIFASRIAMGERYRDEAANWRQRTASSPVAKPSFCPN